MTVMKCFVFLLLSTSAFGACNIDFNCPAGKATVNGKVYPIACNGVTGKDMRGGGTIGHQIRASGPWRRGLVRPGTPMITTHPRLCYDCFIHVSYGKFSNGCLGISEAGYNAIKACQGSSFAIAMGRTK